MEIIFAVAAFILGTLFGSFINAWVYRYSSTKSMWDRSACPHCNTILEWFELIPVASFVILARRCRTCKEKISLHYPVVETLTGFIFLAGFLVEGLSLSLLFVFALSILLMFIAVYDLKTTIIPNAVVYAAAGLALTYYLLFQAPHLDTSLPLVLFTGPIIATPFALLWLVSRGRWMGLGDAKLALVIGWFLGIVDAISAVIFGFWIGAIVMLIILGIARLSHISYLEQKIGRLTMKSEIPFAPFLIVGMYLVYISGIGVLDLFVWLS